MAIITGHGIIGALEALEQLGERAEATIKGESLLLRSLTQVSPREQPRLSGCPKLETNDSRILASAASLVELFAARLGQTPRHRGYTI
jgi:hypothetical protein